MKYKLVSIDFNEHNNKEFVVYRFRNDDDTSVEIEVNEEDTLLRYINDEVSVKDLNSMFTKVLEMEEKLK